MKKIYKKVCKHCGTRFETEKSNKQLCRECAETRLSEQIRIKRASYKKPEAERKNPSTAKAVPLPLGQGRLKWDMRKCKKCFYGAMLDGSYQICDYISITGHMRPCDPGAECTVFLPKEKGKKKKRATFPFGNGTPGEMTGYVQDSIFRTEKRRRNKYK